MWLNEKWFRCDEILFSMMDCNHTIIWNPIIQIRPSNPFPTEPPIEKGENKTCGVCLHIRKSFWIFLIANGTTIYCSGRTCVQKLLAMRHYRVQCCERKPEVGRITSSFNMICAMRNCSVSVESFAIEFNEGVREKKMLRRKMKSFLAARLNWKL